VCYYYFIIDFESVSSCYFTDPLTELHQKIIGAFLVFDHAHSYTVDVREVGTIIRSLGEFNS
jgi:Ca2+-binding EF-hand superfamily protein